MLRPLGYVGWLFVVPLQSPTEVGDPDGNTRRTQFGDEDLARIGAKAKLARLAAAGRACEADLFEQPSAYKAFDTLGDNRTSQTQATREVGPGRGMAVAHHSKDARECLYLEGGRRLNSCVGVQHVVLLQNSLGFVQIRLTLVGHQQ